MFAIRFTFFLTILTDLSDSSSDDESGFRRPLARPRGRPRGRPPGRSPARPPLDGDLPSGSDSDGKSSRQLPGSYSQQWQTPLSSDWIKS